MQGIKPRTSKLFYQFSLEETIPGEHPLRRIDQGLDLRFLYALTRPYYGAEGQQSIDPVVFFKLCLLGYLQNISRDRALMRYCADSLSARWFIGYDIDEPLPCHSTLSRTRALFGPQVYQQVFLEVLALCVDAGLVDGDCQVADSALVKANADIASMQRTIVLEKAEGWCRQVVEENIDEGAGAEASAEMQSVELPEPDAKPKKQPKSNATHRCTSDPDARIAAKPGKPTGMYYHGQVSVDARLGVITAALGDYGDRQDGQSFQPLMQRMQANLGACSLSPRQVVADAGYSSAANLQWSQQAGLTAYIPNPSGYTPERPGFSWHPQGDYYECTQGVRLSFRGEKQNKNQRKRLYRSSAKDCAGCPLKASCITGKSACKQLTHAAGKPWYDQMAGRLATAKGKRMISRRKAIVEPVLGSLLGDYGMRKVYARGRAAADKHVTLASAAMNLKKWLKHAFRAPKKPAMQASLPLVRPAGSMAGDTSQWMGLSLFAGTVLTGPPKKYNPNTHHFFSILSFLNVGLCNNH